jgi:hypothetical protein
MAATIDDLKASRRSTKGWVTRSVNAINNLLTATVIDVDALEVEEQNLRKRSEQLETVQTQIEALLKDDAEVKQEQDSMEVFMKDIGGARAKCLRALRLVRAPTAPAFQVPPAAAVAPAQVNDPKDVSLVKLTIPKFLGDPLRYQEFWDAFNTSVHSVNKYKDGQKLTLLRMHVDGEAKRALTGWDSTDANYKEAVDYFQRRFGNPELRKDALAMKLLDLEPVVVPDAAKVRHLIDDVVGATRSLEGLGVHMDSFEFMARVLLTKKIPVSMFEDFQRSYKAADERTLKNLITFLEEEVAIMERARTQHGKERDPWSASDGSRGGEQEGTAHALRVSDMGKGSGKGAGGHDKGKGPAKGRGQGKGSGDKERGGCLFCGEKHSTRDCAAEVTLEEKRDKLLEARACFRCAGKMHRSLDCQSDVKCKFCGDTRHMTSMCKKKKDENAKVGQAGGLMRTALVQVNQGPVASLMADTGCSRTFIREDLARQVKAEILREEDLTIETFGGRTERRRCQVVKVRLTGVGCQGKLDVEAVCFPDLGSSGGEFSAELAAECYTSCGPPAHYPGQQDKWVMGILLGEDNYDAVVIGPTQQLTKGLKATRSIFGWMIHGRAEKALVVKVCKAAVDLSQFWELEHLGIKEVDLKKEDVLYQIERKDGRYWVSWPWREELRPSSNKAIAEARLTRLLAKMTDEEKAEYSWALRGLEEEGYVEVAPDVPQGPVSYLPHRPVYKDSTTTKLRIVFDASAKGKGGLSLNDSLKTGPSLLPRVMSVHLRFRQGRHALLGDLCKAFLQIRLNETDRDVTRFLWNGLEYRSTSVLFGATSSPAILQTVLDFHLQTLLEEGEFPAKVLEQIRGDLYVDDLTSSLDTEEEVLEYWETAKEVFKRASMELRKCRTTAEGLKSQVELQEVGGKVLGVLWDETTDELSVEVPNERAGVNTKRGVASVLGRVYDPTGLIMPFITPLKILIQDLWEAGYGWDDEFSEEWRKRATSAVAYLTAAAKMKVPRWIGTKKGRENTTLHCFVDASGRMYAGVIFVRVKTDTGAITHLLASKARLVSPKMREGNFSGRFELLACTLGAKLAQSVVEALGWIDVAVTFWSDSRVALHWIRGAPEKWEVFVRNRVRQIREVAGTWRYVPTKTNVADIPTRERGVDVKQWRRGPEWLSLSEDQWPAEEPMEVEGRVGVEAKIARVQEGDVWKELVTPRVSRWRVLVGSVRRIIERVRRQAGRQESDTVELEEAAVAVIIRAVQRSAFADECEALAEGKEVSRRSPLADFNPFLDGSGVLRMGGRLHKTKQVPPEAVHPAILPRAGSVELLVLSVHADLVHAGVGTTLAELRKKGFWILKGRRTVRTILRQCRVCRRFQAAPFSVPEPPLPVERVTFTRPFGVCGVDLMGPLTLKDGSSVWIALFTCLQMRAVHLELVSGLSEVAMEKAMRRFMSRRGTPDLMWSDHGTNFVALSKTLEAAGILKWRFIVERAPWWGGVWERLIQSSKRLLKTVLKNQMVTYEELDTAVTQVESALNKRPISYQWQGRDNEGTPLPLTPEDFLLWRSSEKDLAKAAERKTEMEDELIQRWRDDYLYGVLGHLKSKPRGGREPRLGEIVLVYREGRPRARQVWPLGRIIRLHPGGDGVIRAAEVQVGDRVWTRPVAKLFPLEMDVLEAGDEQDVKGPDDPHEEAGGEHDIENVMEEPDVEKEMVTEDQDIENVIQEQDIEEERVEEHVTRRGRTVHRPRRFLD